MKWSCTPRGLAVTLALGATLAASSGASMAAPGELRALSDSEMSSVYGRGLSDAAVGALATLTTQQQGNASASSGEALAALAALSDDSTRDLDHQLSQSQQQMQSATAGLQTTIKMTQTLASVTQVLTPADITLAAMTFPLLFGLPALPSLAAITNKH